MSVSDPDQPGAGEEPESQFRLVVAARADATFVVPHGELDLASAPDLEAVLAAQAGPVVVDLRKLSFIDVRGWRVLLQAEARSRQDGMNLRFISGEAVRRLFEVAGVPDELTYVRPPAP